MNAVTTCPDAEALREYLLGGMPHPASQRVRTHVTSCVACSHTIDVLRLNDPLLNYQHHSISMPHSAGSPLSESSCDRRGGSTVTESYALDSPVQTLIQDGALPIKNAGMDRSGLSPPLAADEIGRLDKYLVLKVIGAGGMGAVYLAEDTDLNRHVALKTMKLSIAKFEDARKRFLREARATAAFQHDHIVPIFHVGEENGIPYLAMPLLHGQSLDQHLLGRVEPMPIAEVARLGREIAEGLAAAHKHGLIHRDIKPANICMEEGDGWEGGRVKILDFGLVRSLHEHSHLTRSGVIVGTLSYMSPEQARGTDVDPRSDLFSLGIVLYRSAVGRLPFDGSTIMSVLTALAVEEPEPVRFLNPQIPPALASLIESLLHKKPVDRPSSAQQVAGQLDDIYLQMTGNSTTPAPRIVQETSQPARRRAWLPLVSGSAVMALALLLVIAGRERPVPAREVSVGIEGGDRGRKAIEKPIEFIALFGEHLQQNGGRIQEIEVSPDGRRVASYAAHDRVIRIWATGDRRLLAEIDITGQPVCSLVFSRDARLLAVGTSHEMRLYSMQQTATPLVKAPFIGAVRTIRFSPDGQLLAAADEHSELVLWDLDNETELRRWHFAGPVASLAITSDGRYLATKLSNGTTQLLQVPHRNSP